jgi:hypothetical protein
MSWSLAVRKIFMPFVSSGRCKSPRIARANALA